jgi:uncharacterized membrane protein YidH (DUF202 family)
MIRVDLICWGLAALLAISAGLACKRSRRLNPTLESPHLTGLALLCLLAGLGWRSLAESGWPGAVPVEALALLVAGALACQLWMPSQFDRVRHSEQGTDERPVARSLLSISIVVCGLVIAECALLAWPNPTAAAPQARTWLFGLRSLLGGLGLGGWLVMAPALLVAAARRLDKALHTEAAPHRRWRREWLDRVGALPQAADGRMQPEEPETQRPQKRRLGLSLAGERSKIPIPMPGAPPEQRMDAGHNIPEATRRPRKDLTEVTAPGSASAPLGGIAGTPASPGADSVALALSALKFSYPWLTAALLVGGLWDAAAYANPWRGRPAELWLAAAWLCGAACLAAAAPPQVSRRRDVALCALVLCGAAMALLAAWQIPSLFS